MSSIQTLSLILESLPMIISYSLVAYDIKAVSATVSLLSMENRFTNKKLLAQDHASGTGKAGIKTR